MKIDTERMHDVACSLKQAIRSLETARYCHPESGYGQRLPKWKKDAEWLKRQAKRISSANTLDEHPCHDLEDA